MKNALHNSRQTVIARKLRRLSAGSRKKVGVYRNKKHVWLNVEINHDVDVHDVDVGVAKRIQPWPE
jgi:hypothetical protein